MGVTRYPLAERFKAPQGEGLFSGTQMAFLRLVGCSVGQGVCTHCDTEFDRMRPDLGGGSYSVDELLAWAAPCRHLCLTGGEPLDRDIRELLFGAEEYDDGDSDVLQCHVETSGTVRPDWLGSRVAYGHMIRHESGTRSHPVNLWLTVSPKPGYRKDMVEQADEVKVILHGLGDGPGWPTVEDAVRWADAGKTVYVQPRNLTKTVDRAALDEALDVVARHPQLRVSCQLHKFLETR